AASKAAAFVLASKPVLPTNVVNYASITLDYNGSATYPNPFQQMIKLNISQQGFLTYNGAFADFELFYPNGTIIPAWIESNQSGNLIIWAKLSNTIYSPSSLNPAANVIYIGFNTSKNFLSSSGTVGIGEAPQLSPTYAEYDDGASVFNYYTNFAGTSTPSGWTVSGTVTINNGMSISGSSSGSQIEYTAGTFGTSSLDWYGYATVPTGGSGYYTNFGWYSPSNSNSQGNSWFTYYGQSNYGYGYVTSSGGQATSYSNIAAGSSPNYVFTVDNDGTNAHYAINYAYQSPIYAMQTSTNYIGFRNGAGSSGGGANVFVQWVRVRAYPPNGVMPSYSISGATLSISPSTSTYPNGNIVFAAVAPQAQQLARLNTQLAQL
ncbi:MAG: hypothetical protein ACP5MB_11350, partial [bacterium]